MSVFDRLSDKSSCVAKRTCAFGRFSSNGPTRIRRYTGVYAERFRSDGGINADTELSSRVKDFKGSTQDKTNARIRDISEIMRPNLRHPVRCVGREEGRRLSPASFARVLRLTAPPRGSQHPGEG